MTTTETHVPRVARWAEDRAKFDLGHIWAPERRVTLTYTTSTGNLQGTQTYEHTTLLSALSNYMDGLPSHDPRMLTAEAAYELVLSDLETGTSLAAWPTMRRLVEHALAQMLGLKVAVTEWPEF